MSVLKIVFKATILMTLIVMVSPVFALADEPEAAGNSVAIDTVWTLIAAFLVFFMQAGFAMVETGFTRAKNAANIMMKNLMDFSIGSIAFWLVGFGIMFGADKLGLFGTSGFLLSNADPSTGEGLWQFAYWMFQAVFAATAATIVSGAMAERTRFPAYLLYSFFVCAVIYPIVGHWIWGGGWLANILRYDRFCRFYGSSLGGRLGCVSRGNLAWAKTRKIQ